MLKGIASGQLIFSGYRVEARWDQPQFPLSTERELRRRTARLGRSATQRLLFLKPFAQSSARCAGQIRFARMNARDAHMILDVAAGRTRRLFADDGATTLWNEEPRGRR
jgi:hypothetical protein